MGRLEEAERGFEQVIQKFGKFSLFIWANMG
jgi:hypothetical protein